MNKGDGNVVEFADVKKKSSRRLSCTMKNTSPAIANSIRRTVIAEIPTIAFAFDPKSDTNVDMDIRKNTSPLDNEFLGHRLSLVPIHFNEEETETFDPADYEFHLQVKNRSDEIISVTTKDIEVYNAEGEKYPDEFRERLFPPHEITGEYILITKLKPNMYDKDQGDEVDIVMRGSKNIAKVSSIWCPVSTVVMRTIMDPVVAERVLKERLKPANEESGPRTKEDVDSITRKFYSLEAERYFKANDRGEPNEYYFEVKTIGGLRCEYIVFKALRTLMNRFDDWHTRVAVEDLSLLQEDTNYWQLHINGEDYTLVNLLQSFIYDEYVQRRNSMVKYVGYYKPHPLQDDMIMKFRFDNTLADAISIVDFVKMVSKEIMKKLDGICMSWCTSAKLDKLGVAEVKRYMKTTKISVGGAENDDETQ